MLTSPAARSTPEAVIAATTAEAEIAPEVQVCLARTACADEQCGCTLDAERLRASPHARMVHREQDPHRGNVSVGQSVPY